MKKPLIEQHPEITGERIRQIPKFKNISPEFAEQMADAIKKLCDILYVSVAREMNLKHEREA